SGSRAPPPAPPRCASAAFRCLLWSDPERVFVRVPGVSGLTGHGKAGVLEKPRQARTRKHIVVWDDDRIRLPEGHTRLWVTFVYPYARPCANIAVGHMRWGGHMSHSSGGEPPCAAA